MSSEENNEGKMLSEMANIAAECVRRPRAASIYSYRLRKWVCVDTEEGREAKRDSNRDDSSHPPISKFFKLVFTTAAAGTLLFAVICVVLSLAAGREPPPLFEKIILAMWDLVKIGFGAIVGLLGGRQLQGSSVPAAREHDNPDNR